MTGPALLAVRGGRPVRVPEPMRHVATLPRLFQVVQAGIAGRPAGFAVSYDVRGVPTSIAIDPELDVADDRSRTARTGSACCAPGRGSAHDGQPPPRAELSGS